MDNEVIIHFATGTQSCNIGKYSFGHTEQLHSLIYDVGTQIISQASATLPGFFPGIRFDEIPVTGKGGFKFYQTA